MDGLNFSDFVTCASKMWVPKMGDTTPLGWVVTLGYFYTALLILYMLHKLRRIGPERRRIYVQFWMIVFAFYILMGLNKQLDLQTFITATGRCMSRAEGWYADRRSYQITLVLFGLFGAFAGLYMILYYFQDIAKRCGLAFVGLGITGVYVLLRAVSFHHIDTLLSMTLLDLKFHSLVEIAGILCVAANAMRLAIPHRRRRTLDPLPEEATVAVRPASQPVKVTDTAAPLGDIQA